MQKCAHVLPTAHGCTGLPHGSDGYCSRPDLAARLCHIRAIHTCWPISRRTPYSNMPAGPVVRGTTASDRPGATQTIGEQEAVKSHSNPSPHPEQEASLFAPLGQGRGRLLIAAANPAPRLFNPPFHPVYIISNRFNSLFFCQFLSPFGFFVVAFIALSRRIECAKRWHTVPGY